MKSFNKALLICIFLLTFNLAINYLFKLYEDNSLNNGEKEIVNLIELKYPFVIREPINTKEDFNKLIQVLDLHMTTGGIINN